MLLRKLLGCCLRKFQGFSLYRKIAKFLRLRIRIIETTEEDTVKVHRWFNPGCDIPISHNPNVTNFVAKNGKDVIGFIQLVRHSQDSPYTGYWLFSLTVKTLYRGWGIGEELSRAVMEKAKQENARELSLLVRQDNYKAINLYKKLGFERKISLALEEKLEEEKNKTGRRRMVMSKVLFGEITR